VITTHRSPDGDAIGSSLAFYRFLWKRGYDPHVIVPTPYSEVFHWLPGTDRVLVYEGNEEESREIVEGADIIFCLDFNMLGRLESFRPVVEESGAEKVIIDHHPTPDRFAGTIFSDTKASSTAQLVYELIDLWGETELVDKEVADCLYVGIMTDTGSFRFSSTTPRTHRVAADLKEKGVDGAEIQDKIFDNNPIDQVRLLGYVLNEKLTVHSEYRTAVIGLTMEELERFRAKKGYTEGFVNHGLAVKGVMMSVLFTETPDGAKMSFRSKGRFPVNRIAEEHFNGGGHFNAAGGFIALPLDEAIQRFVELLPAYKERLEHAYAGDEA
jgi:phosphoesterase RecJ-like protein